MSARSRLIRYAVREMRKNTCAYRMDGCVVRGVANAEIRFMHWDCGTWTLATEKLWLDPISHWRVSRAYNHARYTIALREAGARPPRRLRLKWRNRKTVRQRVRRLEYKTVKGISQ